MRIAGDLVWAPPLTSSKETAFLARRSSGQRPLCSSLTPATPQGRGWILAPGWESCAHNPYTSTAQYTDTGLPRRSKWCGCPLKLTPREPLCRTDPHTNHNGEHVSGPGQPRTSKSPRLGYQVLSTFEDELSIHFYTSVAPASFLSWWNFKIRGYHTTVILDRQSLDPGPCPHILAWSSKISPVCKGYSPLCKQALER
ncbi:hypothetical protein VTK26DRAFT_5606 [Humicola hyalothermophila]